MHSAEKGSQIAKDGFENEKDIIKKFNNWEIDSDAQSWLVSMGYILEEIEYVEAFQHSGFKADVQVQVRIKLKNLIDAQNLQLKLVKNHKGFNQIDKRWINKYVEMWNIPDDVVDVIKRYTGENKPSIPNPKDKRRMFANEFSDEEKDFIKKKYAC